MRLRLAHLLRDVHGLGLGRENPDLLRGRDQAGLVPRHGLGDVTLSDSLRLYVGQLVVELPVPSLLAQCLGFPESTLHEVDDWIEVYVLHNRLLHNGLCCGHPRRPLRPRRPPSPARTRGSGPPWARRAGRAWRAW